MQIARGMALSEEQQHAALPMLKPAEEEASQHGNDNDAVENNDNRDQSYSQLLQQKLKRQKRDTAAERPIVYVNLDMLPGTSVNCERLFSAAKFILSDTRKRTSPTLFEALLLLKVNSKFWNVFSVGKAMGLTENTVVPNDGSIVSDPDMVDEVVNDDYSSGPGDLLASSSISSASASSR